MFFKYLDLWARWCIFLPHVQNQTIQLAVDVEPLRHIVTLRRSLKECKCQNMNDPCLTFCACTIAFVRTRVTGEYHTWKTVMRHPWAIHLVKKFFKRMFFNENIWISINISLKFDPKGSINNIPALVQIMAWRRPGDKPLSELMMVNLPTHICATRPQWVNFTENRWAGVVDQSALNFTWFNLSRNVQHFLNFKYNF